MIIVKSPLRISLFGGATDYKDFYSQNGGFVVGFTIDKYVYSSLRYRPRIVGNESIISYSIQEKITDFSKIQNPLFRTIINEFNFNKNPVDIHYFSDIPARTGLGGSSSCCCSLIYAFHKLNLIDIDAKTLAKEAIRVEREILKEPGGIQDQIWASFGSFNSIEIKKDGDFSVRPVPLSLEFKKDFNDSLLLIYSNEQRISENPSRHSNTDEKNNILEIAKQGINCLIKENVSEVGELLYQSWQEKKKINKFIETSAANQIITDVMNRGAYGAKLLGAGGCGFVLVVANQLVCNSLREIYKYSVLDFKFDNDGTSSIFNQTYHLTSNPQKS